MRIFILVSALLVVTQLTTAQLPNYTLAIQGGGPFYDQGRAVASDNAGNIVMTGVFEDSLAAFGDSVFTSFGQTDCFLAKYDQNGAFLWAKQLSSPENVFPYSVTSDGSDNIIVGGEFQNTLDLGDTALTSAGSYDAFVVKYDKDGTLLWARSIGGRLGGESAQAVATDDAGNIAVTGFYYVAASFGDTTLISPTVSGDIFVARYTGAGQLLWVSSAGGVGSFDEGSSIVYHSDGTIYTSGRISYPGGKFGTTTIDGGGGYIAKYTSDGQVIWVTPTITTGLARAIQDIGLDEDGDVYGVGYFSDTLRVGTTILVTDNYNDALVLRLASDGTPLYAEQITGTKAVYGLTLAMEASSDFFTIAGYFSGAVEIGDTTLDSGGSSNTNSFIAAYTLGGFPAWAIQVRGPGSGTNRVGGSDTDGNGGILFTGSFQASLPAGDTTLTSRGGFDAFVFRLNTAGTVDVQPTKSVPEAYRLWQNYPNPFNPSTTIEYALPYSGYVTMRVYNILGEEVATLLAGDHAPGTFKATWDASILPSGVYFYRLTAGEYVQTRKMILMK